MNNNINIFFKLKLEVSCQFPHYYSWWEFKLPLLFFLIDERERRWVKLAEDAPLGAVNTKPVVMKIGSQRLDVTHFKVVKKSGNINLGGTLPDHPWGIGDNLYLAFTTNVSSPIDDTSTYAPASYSLFSTTSFARYPGMTSSTEELILETKVPTYFREGEYIVLWNIEDLTGWSVGDNSGEVVLDVYALGKCDPLS